MNPKKRRMARKYAIQALYTWEISKNNISKIEKYYLKNINIQDVDIAYFHELITAVTLNYEEIDKKIILCLHRKSQEIGKIEKAILRISFYELYNRIDIPYKVSINEGIELAKIFGSTNSHKFINGVLDQATYKIKRSGLK
ncbi:transcription antitermination factor NusB [Buchnera aphidicola]|uniref:transcription antitermination factor NusB n=1 Tax=Buchnera aphidicola TaxID=9 RepID=UPI0031B84BC5